MKKDFFLTRYALIIKKLEAAPANYSQIADYLLNTHEFQDADVTSYSVRTLQRDILEISRLFNLSIPNKKKQLPHPASNILHPKSNISLLYSLLFTLFSQTSNAERAPKIHHPKSIIHNPSSTSQQLPNHLKLFP